MANTLGDILGFSAQVKDAAGVLANAGTMTLTVIRPDGTAEPGSPFNVTPISTGLYEKDITSTQAGRYHAYWQATGANAGAHTQVFTVGETADRAIVSLAGVKKHLNIPAATITHDDELEWMIGAATGIVENHPDVGVGAVVRRTISGERQHHEYGRAAVWLNNPPVISVTTVAPVATGGTAVTVADLDVDPSGEIRYKDGYTRFPAGTYQWTYVVGRTVIPDEITGAALILVKGMWDTQRGAGVQSSFQGGMDVAEAPGMGVYFWRTKMLLAPHKQAAAVA
jgi:hypothetical protein